MGTLNAFYVRAGEDDTAIATAIRAKFRTAEIEAGTPFWGVTLPEEAFEVPERDLAELSSHLKTDIIWLGFQSVVDAFQFHRWQSGKKLRALVYGCFTEERTWEHAEGTPEPWEKDVFFNPEELDRRLDFLDSDDEKRELQRIWEKAQIDSGNIEPSLDARESARESRSITSFRDGDDTSCSFVSIRGLSAPYGNRGVAKR